MEGFTTGNNKTVSTVGRS